MTYAKNSLGRSTGRRFNMAAIRRELDAKQIMIARQARIRERRQKAKSAYLLEHPINPFA